jgi:hypothetical protein
MSSPYKKLCVIRWSKSGIITALCLTEHNITNYATYDLKSGKLTHNDVGQMQMYVNYFDRSVITEGDNPTIGLILCAEKNDVVVQYTLDKSNKQIFASKYQFHLPTEAELLSEVKKEIEDIANEYEQLEDTGDAENKIPGN